MSVSLRSHFVTGVAAVAAAALVASPTTVSAHPLIQPTERAVTARVDLAASVKPIVLEPLRPEQTAAARAAISRIDPDSRFAVAAAPPATLNAASDWVVGAYQWLQYWVNYGVELADYALQFIPFGYFLGDQINIFYDYLITPIADSVVYGLIVPVLNDPLNISSWVNGLGNVGQTAITAAINTVVAEFNYFFGWLVPPLPPRPLPLAVQTVEPLETVEDASLMSATLEEVTDEKVGTEIEPETEVTETEVTDPEVVTPGVVTPEVTTPEVPEVVTPETPEVPVVVTPEVPVDETTHVVAPETDDETIAPTTPTKLTPTKLTPAKLTPIKSTPIKSTLGTVSAQGEVRGGATTTPATDTKPAAAASSDKEKPAPESTPSGASTEQTDKTSATDKTDAGKTEKKEASTD